MASLTGETIASSYDLIVKRHETYSQTGTNIELMTDSSGATAATGLYLESGATTSNIGMGVAAPGVPLDVQYDVSDGSRIARFLNGELTNDESVSIAVGRHPSDNYNMGILGFKFLTANSDQDSYIGLGLENNEFILNVTGHGKVGMGTVTPVSALEIQAGNSTTGAILTLGTQETTVVANDVLGRINFYAPKETDGTDAIATAASISAVAQDTFTAAANSTALHFQTGDSEDATGTTASMVIDQDGNIGIGTTSPNRAFHVEHGTDNTVIARFANTSSEPKCILLEHPNKDSASDNTADDEFFECKDDDTVHFVIYGDGDWSTKDGSEVASDRRIKKNITDATSKLDDINKIQVRNFNFCNNDGSDLANTTLGKKRIGFIAQELEEIFPSVVHEKPHLWAGKDYDDFKRVSSGALVPMLVKAIQELSAKVTALENA
tara:strand:+ start:1188 stop:2498 length:1311 start_codon:yes stop_codon:yes gene_type:complete